MTQSEVTLVNDSVESGPSRILPRASAHARARLAATVSDGKGEGIRAAVAADFQGWWLLAARPPSLKAWRRAQKVNAARVPGGSPAVGAGWAVDNWTHGAAWRGLGIVFYLLAGGCTWLAGHPARRWPALLIIAAGTAWLLLYVR